MRVILFGATGMVGHGALLECLRDPGVAAVLACGRSPVTIQHPKLTQIVTPNLFDLFAHAAQLTGYDTCLFCLGVSSIGMDESAYRRTTHDLTLSIAQTLLSLNPALSFVYVSGANTNADGRQMWQRVKGQTENELLAMPFLGAYLFRPGYIHPVDGFTGKTLWVRALYVVATPLYPFLKRLLPTQLTTTRDLARAMLAAVRRGLASPSERRHVFETRNIFELSRVAAAHDG